MGYGTEGVMDGCFVEVSMTQRRRTAPRGSGDVCRGSRCVGVCGAGRRFCVSFPPTTLPRGHTNPYAHAARHINGPSSRTGGTRCSESTSTCVHPLSRRICTRGVWCLSGAGLSGGSSSHPANVNPNVSEASMSVYALVYACLTTLTQE